MTYPPVGYVCIRHYETGKPYYEMMRFYHDYESAKKYCDEQNKDGTKIFYYEPCEVEIYD